MQEVLCSTQIMANSRVLSHIGGFPGGLAGKESAYNAGGPSLIPGLGRSPGESNSYSLQYSGLENSMDCVVHGVKRVGHN